MDCVDFHAGSWLLLGVGRSGTCPGPDEGWVSPSVSGKDIVVKVRDTAKPVTACHGSNGFIRQVASQQEIGKITVQSSKTWTSLAADGS